MPSPSHFMISQLKIAHENLEAVPIFTCTPCNQWRALRYFNDFLTRNPSYLARYLPVPAVAQPSSKCWITTIRPKPPPISIIVEYP